MIESLIKDFQQIFGEGETERVFFAPGRVNLIGEHTDYNGGHVFPCALSIGTYAIGRKRSDNKVRVYSKNFSEKQMIEFSLTNLVFDEKDDWANYPKGVLHEFKQNGYLITEGMDVLFYGNIPNGAGLSSSASIELVTSVMINELFELQVDMLNMVKMSQRAENEFIKVNCGIMDQFAIGMGKKDCAILLDCNTLQYTYSSLSLENASLIIANTNKRRGLADSKYNERRRECERALQELKPYVNIAALGDLTVDQFEEVQGYITNPVVRKRAKHAVYENARTMEAVRKLEDGNIEGFGKLMNESHISLRDDYEVTGKELDALVEAAWAQEGVIGARMTGAGFGGCTVNLVKKEYVENFILKVREAYKNSTGLHADFYIVEIGDGAKEIKTM